MANGTKIQTSRATSNRIIGRGSYGLSAQAGGANPNALPMPQGISINTATGFGQAQMIAGNTMMSLGNTIGKIGIAIDQQNEVNEKAALVAQGNTLEQLTKQFSTITGEAERETFYKDIYKPAYDNLGKGVRDSLIPIVNSMRQSFDSQRQVIETGFLAEKTVAATRLNLNKNKDSLISARSIPEWYKYYLDYESNLMTAEGSSIIDEKIKSKEREAFHKIKNNTLLSLAKEKFNGLYQTLSSEKFGTLLEKFVDKGNLYDPSDTNLSQTQKAELALLEKVLDKNIGPSEIRDLFFNAQKQKLDSLKQKNDFHDEREEALNRNGDMAEQKNIYEKDVFQRLYDAGSIEKQSSLLTQLNAEVRLEKDSYLRPAKKKILKDVFERMKTISRDQKNNLELLMNAIGDKVDDTEVGGTGNTWKDLFLFGIDGKKLTTDQMNAAIGRLRKQFPEIDTAKNTNLVIESTFRKVYGAESKIYQSQKNQLKIERGKIEEQAKRQLTTSEGTKYKAKKNAQLDAAVGSHLGKSTFNEALKEYGNNKDLDGDKPPPGLVIPERKPKAIVKTPSGSGESVNLEDANPDDVLTNTTRVQGNLNIRVEDDSKNDVAAQHVMRITDGDPSVLFTEGTREDRNKMVSKYLKDNKISPRSRKAREIYDYINTIENNFIDKLRSAYSEDTNPHKILRKQIAEGLQRQMEEIPEGLRKQVEELKGSLKGKFQRNFNLNDFLLQSIKAVQESQTLEARQAREKSIDENYYNRGQMDALNDPNSILQRFIEWYNQTTGTEEKPSMSVEQAMTEGYNVADIDNITNQPMQSRLAKQPDDLNIPMTDKKGNPKVIPRAYGEDIHEGIDEDQLIQSYAQTVNAMRPQSRKNADGSVSTVLMASMDNEAFPTLFPNNDGTWTDFGKDFKAAYKEAEKRGEIFKFNTPEGADKFARGAWKQFVTREKAATLIDSGIEKVNTPNITRQPTAGVFKSTPSTTNMPDMPKGFTMSGVSGSSVQGPTRWVDVGDGTGEQRIRSRQQVEWASKKDAKKAFEKLFSGNTETDKLSKKAGEMLIDYEGVAKQPYFDTKGIPTFGLGFTGDEMSLGDKSNKPIVGKVLTKFKEILPKYINIAKTKIIGSDDKWEKQIIGIHDKWEKLSPNLKVALTVAAYRGDIAEGHFTSDLLRSEEWQNAATEFLDHFNIAQKFLGYTGTKKEWHAIAPDDKKGLVERIRVAIENKGKEYGKGTLKHRFQYIYNSIKKEADRKSKKGKN